MPAAYTEKEIDVIAAWLKEGLSASRIAGRFSALCGSPVSRNAIIGIVHRNAGLRAIGFANPKGGRAGGRPRKNTARPDRPGRRGRAAAGGVTLCEPAALSRHAELAESASAETANLPPNGGDARSTLRSSAAAAEDGKARGGRCPADISAYGAKADEVDGSRSRHHSATVGLLSGNPSKGAIRHADYHRGP
ncbi:hypothetical protein [Mesorhizobium silamurunense]|uniref:hypothetical protein n=1 Tax=Mesorhizobium silamurunense TaxID=499528 RepID=UPI001FEE9CC3|nr:hypothetical protein [Mesorhizobium silamurunense]